MMNMELYEKLSHLQWLMHRQHLRSRAAAGPAADMTRGQGRILAFLRMKDKISTKDLSYLLGIRVSSLNELLLKLEKTGYITRESAEDDKRVMLIHLTDKGRTEEALEVEMSDAFSGLSNEEQAAFGEYLDRVIAALDAELSPDDRQDKIFSWMKAAKERMGPEQFEKLMAMHGGKHGMRGGFGGRHFGCGGHGRHPGGHGHHSDECDCHSEGRGHRSPFGGHHGGGRNPEDPLCREGE